MKLWQQLCDNWSKLVFKERYKDITPKIRAFRALEEMLELAQAEDVTEEEVLIIVRQVYDKPKGEPHQELGGVVTCLAAYSATSGLDMEECFLKEYMRICDPAVMEKVRKRNLDGDKIGFKKERFDRTRSFPQVKYKPDTEKATIEWSTGGGREGWYLFRENGTKDPIMGPSICISSGGGPIAALNQVVSRYGDTLVVKTKVPEHTDVRGHSCTDCAEGSYHWNRSVDTSIFISNKPILVLGKEEGERMSLGDLVKGVVPLSVEVNLQPHQKMLRGTDIPKPHGFDLEGHDWDGQRIALDKSWKPISEAPAEEGFGAPVIVNGIPIGGRFIHGEWIDNQGETIEPTHFKER